MDTNTKYKHWGWGAVIGLVAVILIAGLVVAVTMSSPKKSEVASEDENNVASVVEGDTNEGDTADNTDGEAGEDVSDEKDSTGASEGGDTQKDNAGVDGTDGVDKNTGNSDNSNTNVAEMPKTGPSENLLSLVALAVIAGLVAHNLSFVRKNA